MTERVTWTAKISGPGNHADLPPGADFPMRQAVRAAFREVVGADSDYLSSGWGTLSWAATPSEPEPPALDVERLHRAMHGDEPRLIAPLGCGLACEWVAAEYARLATPASEEAPE